MRRLKIMGLALVFVLALSAVVASAPAAASPTLHLGWGAGEEPEAAVTAGANFEMNNFTAVTFELGGWAVTCTGNQGLVGSDETNNEKTDKIKLEAGYGTLSGSELCSSSLGLGSTAKVEFIGPWTLALSTNKKAEMLAPKKALVLVYIEFSGSEKCFYELKKLKGTWATEKYESLYNDTLTMNFAKQKLKLYKRESGGLCPKTTTLNAPFQLQYAEEEGGLWYVRATVS